MIVGGAWCNADLHGVAVCAANRLETCITLMAIRTAQPCQWWCCETTLTAGLVVDSGR